MGVSRFKPISPLTFTDNQSKVCIVFIHGFFPSMELKNQVLSYVSWIFCCGMFIIMLLMLNWVLIPWVISRIMKTNLFMVLFIWDLCWVLGIYKLDVIRIILIYVNWWMKYPCFPCVLNHDHHMLKTLRCELVVMVMNWEHVIYA